MKKILCLTISISGVYIQASDSSSLYAYTTEKNATTGVLAIESTFLSKQPNSERHIKTTFCHMPTTNFEFLTMKFDFQVPGDPEGYLNFFHTHNFHMVAFILNSLGTQEGRALQVDTLTAPTDALDLKLVEFSQDKKDEKKTDSTANKSEKT